MDYLIGSVVMFVVMVPLVVMLNLENRRLVDELLDIAKRQHSPGDDDDADDDDTDDYECQVDVTRGTGPDGMFTASDLWDAAEQIGDGPFASGIRQILAENRRLNREPELKPVAPAPPAGKATARS
jgi:hypothetical protein